MRVITVGRDPRQPKEWSLWGNKGSHYEVALLRYKFWPQTLFNTMEARIQNIQTRTTFGIWSKREGSAVFICGGQIAGKKCCILTNRQTSNSDVGTEMFFVDLQLKFGTASDLFCQIWHVAFCPHITRSQIHNLIPVGPTADLWFQDGIFMPPSSYEIR